MSVTYVKSKKLFDVLPQYRVDQSQITNRTTGVEYITFHNRNTYSNIRLRIPAGTEVTGVIVRKISNSQKTRATAPTPQPDVHDKPADLRDVGDWYDNFKFLTAKGQ